MDMPNLQIAQIVKFDRDTTRYLLRDGNNELFWGYIHRPVSKVESMDPRSLPRVGRIDAKAFFPPLTKVLKHYTGKLDDRNVYIKRPLFLKDMHFAKSSRIQNYHRSLLSREVEFCEILARNPHPSICPYLGVVAENVDFGHGITGIAYKRYASDLMDLVAGNEFNWSKIPLVMESVKSGMEHMHSLGLVHCDLRPQNIFVTGDEVVVGDFDAVHYIGEEYTTKCSPSSWLDCKGEKNAGVEWDYRCLERFEKWFEDWKKEHELVVSER